MNVRSVLHHPVRVAATVVAAALMFAAGSAVSNADGSEAVHTAAAETHTDAPIASVADADTLWQYLGTLPPAARAQTLIALNPNLPGALEAIITSNMVAAVQH